MHSKHAHWTRHSAAICNNRARRHVFFFILVEKTVRQLIIILRNVKLFIVTHGNFVERMKEKTEVIWNCAKITNRARTSNFPNLLLFFASGKHRFIYINTNDMIAQINDWRNTSPFGEKKKNNLKVHESVLRVEEQTSS